MTEHPAPPIGSEISAAQAESQRTPALYVLTLLTLVYAFNQLDRQILALLLESIKKDLDVSDTVLGLVSGFGFATIYVVAGLFASRLADRSSRMKIISVGLAFYSAVTVLTAFAQNILQLALSRVGIALGESTSIAPSTSVISDYFSVEHRARAMSVFAGGGLLAAFILFPVLGWVDQTYGWRAAFVTAGVPGLLLALLLILTVREPPRAAVEKVALDQTIEPIGDTLRFLVRQRSVRLACIAAIFGSWNLYCFAIWSPTFLSRVHDFSQVEVGWATGILYNGCGMVGGLLGGVFTDWVGRRDGRLRLAAPALASLLTVPMGLIFLLSNDRNLMLAAYGGLAFFTIFPFGSVWAALQSAVKVRMRSLGSAVYLGFWMMGGLGLGTLTVGAINDMLAPSMGQTAIRYSLIAPIAMQLIGAPLLAIAGLSLPRDIARTQRSA